MKEESVWLLTNIWYFMYYFYMLMKRFIFWNYFEYIDDIKYVAANVSM